MKICRIPYEYAVREFAASQFYAQKQEERKHIKIGCNLFTILKIQPLQDFSAHHSLAAVRHVDDLSHLRSVIFPIASLQRGLMLRIAIVGELNIFYFFLNLKSDIKYCIFFLDTVSESN